jgi:hypothetical protein
MHAPVHERTPFSHCLFGAGVWYVAVLVGYGIAEFRTGTDTPITVVEAIVGGIAFPVSATLMWVFLRLIKAHLSPSLMILVALPIFGVIWFALHVLAFLFVVAFVMPH